MSSWDDDLAERQIRTYLRYRDLGWSREDIAERIFKVMGTGGKVGGGKQMSLNNNKQTSFTQVSL